MYTEPGHASMQDQGVAKQQEPGSLTKQLNVLGENYQALVELNHRLSRAVVDLRGPYINDKAIEKVPEIEPASTVDKIQIANALIRKEIDKLSTSVELLQEIV